GSTLRSNSSAGEGPVVVITGGTKGIGLGLARALLGRGARVVIAARGRASVEEACAGLADAAAPGRVAGFPCDVSRHEDVQALWEQSVARFGRVDIWVNNAGTTNVQLDFVDLDPGDLAAVVATNLTGVAHGTHVAARGMRAQGHGAIYNMEGFGSDGSRQPGMALYGSTKAALRYLTQSVAAEMARTPVLVCRLSPGVVVTELLVKVYREGDPAKWRRARWLFRFIADPVEPVAAWLADAVLRNRRTGVRLAYMTVPRAIGRVFLPRYHRRDLFAGQLPASG
ncbi:MAG: SDR family oxidoreductase, partial [Myxococcales bacterium]